MKRKMFMWVFVMVFCSIIILPAFAAKRQRIPNINVTVVTDKTEITLDDIEVQTGSAEYSCVSKEYNPISSHVILKLQATDGYYFAMKKASQVMLTGATYIRGTKMEGSAVLELTVALPETCIWKEDWKNWVPDGNGIKYLNDDGTYASPGWKEIDQKQYYFDENGYVLVDTRTPDGYYVNSEGVWDGKSAMQAAGSGNDEME